METQAIRNSLQADAAAGQPAANASSPAATQAERAKALELAREFEAYFVTQMIRQMRQSMLDEPAADGLGADTMTDTIDVELARQLTNAGGIGLAKVLGQAFDRQAGITSAASAASSTSAMPLAPQTAALLPWAVTGLPAAPEVTVADSHEESLPTAANLGGPISSKYGYRRDPFSGATRFHAGIDIAAAYGREVPAAGAGTVVFSGEQGGYGNTVVVEHDSGLRTRYAHLSSIQVEAGSTVQAGAVVGRVGSTGRSTGPHLHFEVLQDGRSVDPAVAATRFAGQLKIQGLVADLPNSQPSALGVAVGVDDEDSGQ